MRDAFFKSLKWYSIVLFLMVGMAALYYADRHDDIRPVFPAILCFGMSSVLTTVWKLSGKLVFLSLGLVIGLAYLAQTQYLPGWIYAYTGYALRWHFLSLWLALTTAIGIPVMTYVYDRYGDRFD